MGDEDIKFEGEPHIAYLSVQEMHLPIRQVWVLSLCHWAIGLILTFKDEPEYAG